MLIRFADDQKPKIHREGHKGHQGAQGRKMNSFVSLVSFVVRLELLILPFGKQADKHGGLKRREGRYAGLLHGA
jgi:hypothetical protein